MLTAFRPNPCVSSPTHPADIGLHKFLKRFPPEKRSAVANDFLRVVRLGITDPKDVERRVLATARQSGLQPHGERARQIVAAIVADPLGALDYAAEKIAWEAVPLEERRAIKAERQKARKAAYMSLPPTDAQIRYLRHLGHAGRAPAGRAEASRLIEKLKDAPFAQEIMWDAGLEDTDHA